LPFPFIPTDLAPARGTSTRAAHTTGTGFSIWGGGISTALNKSLQEGSVQAPYDASAYKAISFWLKAPAGTTLAVGFQTAATVPPSEGGTCSSDCYNPFRRVISIPNTDDGSWKQVVIALNGIDLTQWTTTGQTFHSSELLLLLFSAVSPPANFEFWV